jgi:hypothetical protein
VGGATPKGVIRDDRAESLEAAFAENWRKWIAVMGLEERGANAALGDSLALIREAVEELAPAGALPASEQFVTAQEEAAAIVAAVHAIAACTRCAGTGWVCEAHPDKPMEHDGCTGAGEPCPWSSGCQLSAKASAWILTRR